MLTNINLFQFKRFKSESIELLPLTMLTGVNGMGKSTIIQSLLILRQSFDRGELQNNGKMIIEDKELVNLISPNDMLCSDADSNKVSIGFSDDNGNKANWTVIAAGNSNTLPFSYENSVGNIYSSELFDEQFQYLSAERIGPRASYDRLTVTRPHSPIGYRGEFVANRILESVTKVEDVKLTGAVLKNSSIKVYDQLSAWVSEIVYPGTKVSIDDSDTNRINLIYAFKEEETKTFNPVNTGFGFSYALPVILAILTAKPGSLLIVENPEAHLHPKGQSMMGKLLSLAASSGLQIIVESHSDHIINGIRIAVKQGLISSSKVKLLFFGTSKKLSSKKYSKEEPQIDLNGRITQWPADFFDTWENSMMELL
jgi:predicted ATPase